MKKRILRDAALVLIIFAGVSIWQTRDMVPSGDPAPALSGPMLEGGEFSLAAQKGKPVLVYFFAPWCGVCKVSASNAAWIRKVVSADQLTVAAVALDYESEASIGEFVKNAGIESLPIVRGSDAIRDQYKVTAYPTYYVVDADGNVKSKSVGYSTLPGMFLRTLLGRF